MFSSYDKLLPLTELRASKFQRNIHPPEQIKRLAKIMRECGVRHPIHISKRSGEICFGHGRKEAALLNGWSDFPIVYQDFDSDDAEYISVQNDNSIASWAELDFKAINLDLENLGPFDIDLLGIKDFVVEPLDKFQAQTDEDEIPEHVEPKSKLGDIYQLGQHRLMCGDSTSIDAVERLMNGEKADMVFTDPPYGISYENTKGGIMGDGTLDAFKDSCALIPAFAGESCHGYIFFGIQLAAESLTILNGIFKQYNILVMPITHQNKPGPPGYYNSNYEVCFFTQIGSVKKHNPGFGSVSEITLNDSRYEGDGKLVRYRALGDEKITEHNLKTVHPTEKKVSGIEFYLNISSNSDDLVLDLFGGSGSTLIASEKTNRKCFMSEIDPHYVDIIITRWENYTGKKAELLNG